MGAAAWLTWGTTHATRRVPLYIGDLVGGLRAMFDVDGNFTLSYAYANASEYRTTQAGGSVTISSNVSTAILAGSGAQTVLLPVAPINGQELPITLETAYDQITLDGNGKTLIAGAALGVAAGSFARYRYRAANATWHRVG